jgi:hypothetical protein
VSNLLHQHHTLYPLASNHITIVKAPHPFLSSVSNQPSTLQPHAESTSCHTIDAPTHPVTIPTLCLPPHSTDPPPPPLCKFPRLRCPTHQCLVACCSHARPSSSVLNQGNTTLGHPFERCHRRVTIEVAASSGYNVLLFSRPKLSLWRIIAPGEVRSHCVTSSMGVWEHGGGTTRAEHHLGEVVMPASTPTWSLSS